MTLPAGSVWLDAQGAQNARYPERGLARHVIELTRALLEAAPEAIGAVGLNPALPVPAGLDFLEGDERARAPVSRLASAEEHPPIYHLPSPFEHLGLDPLWPDWARGGAVRTVVTVHDLIPLIFRERYLDPHPFSAAFFLGRLGLVRCADWVLAISQSTAADTVELLGVDERRITVIDSGVSTGLAGLVPDRAAAEAALAQSGIDPRPGFLLYVAGDDWRKNLEGTVSGYALLPDAIRAERQLVIACDLPEGRRRELLAHAAGLGLGEGQVLLAGRVSDAQLAALYRSCELFVFPSLYEGAGLPVLEAMSCGAPVAASRTSSIPEILGDLEASFDPADPADIARCLEEALTAPGRLESLRERSARRASLFTWERVARLTLEGYERALELPRSAPRRPRRRVAILGPWPPRQGAVLGEEAIARLGERADVELFAPALGDRPPPPGVALLEPAEFEWRHSLQGYDRLVYVLGASPSKPSFDALEGLVRRPGVVVVDDEPLERLYRDLYRSRYRIDPRRLAELHERAGAAVAGSPNGGDPERSFTELMASLLEARAERVLRSGDREQLDRLL